MPPPFPPGSFTKNFGWESIGPGLSGLHGAIRRGFGNELSPTPRRTFREACDVSFYIVANFFLFSSDHSGIDTFQVDELVRQAVTRPHSTAFDRLALFVLNLSLAGKRTGGQNGDEFPALWANSFVKDILWQDGRWQRQALGIDEMSTSMTPLIKGTSQRKTITNYRHIYELAKVPVHGTGAIVPNTAAWLPMALFATWDRRHVLAGPSAPLPLAGEMVQISRINEDHKLLGISLAEFDVVAPGIAQSYWLGRSAGAAPAARRRASGMSARTTISKPPREPSELVLAEATDTAVERRLSANLSQVRDRSLAAALKRHYRHRCMACAKTVVVGLDPERRYAEAAHIRPLGSPHEGPDSYDNMLVLCPNHHLQFDYGVLGIEVHNGELRFVSTTQDPQTHHRTVNVRPPHLIAERHAAWHRKNIMGLAR